MFMFRCPSLARFVMRDGHGIVAMGVIKTVKEANPVAPPKAPGKQSLNKRGKR